MRTGTFVWGASPVLRRRPNVGIQLDSLEESTLEGQQPFSNEPPIDFTRNSQNAVLG